MSIAYLGDIISHNGVAPDPTKIDAMVDCPVSTIINYVDCWALWGFIDVFIEN